MQLGSIAQGFIRTFRYFRGHSVIQNKLGILVSEPNPTGGISFMFEINYPANILSFAAAITREDDNFNYAAGRAECIYHADRCASSDALARLANDPNYHLSDVHAFQIKLDADAPLVDQVFNALEWAHQVGELKKNKFLQTLYSRMKKYDKQNGIAEEFLQELDNSSEDDPWPTRVTEQNAAWPFPTGLPEKLAA